MLPANTMKKTIHFGGKIETMKDLRSPVIEFSKEPTTSRRAFRDRLALGLGAACAFHCVATPLIVVLLPSFGLGLLSEPWFEVTLLAFVLVLGGSSVLHGYKQHRRGVPVILFAIAFLGLCADSLFASWDGAWALSLLISTGLLASLLWNLLAGGFPRSVLAQACILSSPRKGTSTKSSSLRTRAPI
jgi:hypothetical protein